MLAVVSPLGWAAAATSLAFGWIGARQGWAEFRAIGIILAVALLAGLAMSFGRPQYQVAIDLVQLRVGAGERVLGRVLLRRTGGRSIVGGSFELPVGRVTATFSLPALAHGGEHEQIFAVPTRRRSIVKIGPVQSVQGDPLGLIRREQRWSDATHVYVHPPIVPLVSGSRGLMRDVEGTVTQTISQSDLEFQGLRAYMPGDHQRSIHWRTSARMGRLMVRQYEETRRVHMMVLLSVRAEDYADEAEFELAVSSAASLGVLALQEERQLTVATQTGTVASVNRAVLLDQMSGIDTTRGAGDLRTLAATAVIRNPHASVIAMITGSAPSAIDLRAADATLPRSARTFAVQCDAGSAVDRKPIGRLIVLRIPALIDLRRAVSSL